MLSPLRPGSRVALLSPAGPTDPALVRAGLELLAERYQVSHDPASVLAGDAALPYLAGSDRVRATRLERALADPEVDGVICVRGGYGCLRILPLLDGRALARRRLPLVGFSDCTALHAWAQGLGVPTVHGPVVTQLPRLPEADRQALFDLLEGRGLPHLTDLHPVAPGRARGPLAGGNLATLVHLLGTPYQPDLAGRILLLEEVGEAPYRLDRLLTHLRLSGALERVAGVVVGRLERCDAPQGQPPVPTGALEVVRERLSDLGVPVVTGAPVGHGARNVALPLGYPAVLDAARGSLAVEAPA